MGIRRDGAWVKQQRIKAIHKMISGPGNTSLTRILAFCEFKFGINRDTARNYLQILEDLDFIEIDEQLDIIREVKIE